MKTTKIFFLLATLVILTNFFGQNNLALAATSLYADLSASPNSGQAPLNNVSLTASVSGDATGAITYRFDCTSDGNWDWIQTTSTNPYTASNICNYPTAGNYTATIKVERENLAFQGTVAIFAQSQATPTVDLKANGYDGSITISYNNSATLSWTSSNASSCYASGDWSGSKYTSGSESTGSLTSSKNYTITCTGSGGVASDSVSVLVSSSPQTLYVGLEAIPNSGTAPLSGVDLRATVTGTATGTINYKFDCTSDGIWDQTFYGISDNPKTVVDACNYQNQGSYVAKVRVERGTANPAEATAVVVVGSGTQDVNIVKLARNLSDNTAFGEVTVSDPGEVIEFRILINSASSSQISNLTVKDTLPDKMSYYGSLKVDDVNVSGNIGTGLDIGSLNPQQARTVVFQAVVAGASNFSYGTTELINTVLVYNTSLARTDTAKIQVTKTEVKGATDVPTGMLDSAKISFIVSGLATLLLTYFLLLKFYLGNRAYVWGVNDAFESAKEKIAKFLPKEPGKKKEERLARIIEEIRKREKLD